MIVFFIDEIKKVSIFKSLFKNIVVNEDKIMLHCQYEKLGLKSKKKIVDKITRVLNNENVKRVIISKKLKKDKYFTNLIYSNGFDIVDGKNLMKKLVNQIIDKVCIENKIESQNANISISINNLNGLEMNSIYLLAKKFKSLNIVTNNTNYFIKLKEKLWNEEGIIITLTNNKKKALAQSNIILNVDFPEEMINKYTIYGNGILINLEENVRIKKKRFNGKIINDYEVKVKENTEMEKITKDKKYINFDIRDILEIYLKNSPEEIQNLIIV